MDGWEGLQVSSLLHDVGTAWGPHGRGWLGACVTRCFGYIRKDIRWEVHRLEPVLASPCSESPPPRNPGLSLWCGTGRTYAKLADRRKESIPRTQLRQPPDRCSPSLCLSPSHGISLWCSLRQLHPRESLAQKNGLKAYFQLSELLFFFCSTNSAK